MIHTSSTYNPGSYGQKHFRNEDPKKWISDKVGPWHSRKAGAPLNG